MEPPKVVGDQHTLLLGESEGRIAVPLMNLPPGVLAVSVPRPASAGGGVPRDRKRLLHPSKVDLVAVGHVPVLQVPGSLSLPDRRWVLKQPGRTWQGIQARFGGRAWDVSLDLVRAGGVVLRCEVDRIGLGRPIRWELSKAWASLAPDELAAVLERRDPDVARRELLAVMTGVEQLDDERVLLQAVEPGSLLRVPAGSATATGPGAWQVYEAAIRAAACWWRESGPEAQYRLTAKELAARALGGSKEWNGPRQQAFSNVVDMPFGRAVELEETDWELRLRGPLRWWVGDVAADARVSRPWISLPLKSVQVLGDVEHDEVKGVLVTENEDTFAKVSRMPEVVDRWLCVWGRGYALVSLAPLLRMLGHPVAAWLDPDAYSVEMANLLMQGLGQHVATIGMDLELWRKSPKRRMEPSQVERHRRTASRLMGHVAAELEPLVAAIAATGEACEQEAVYRDVIPSLARRLRAIEASSASEVGGGHAAADGSSPQAGG